MSRLTEKYVQRKSIKYLAAYYQERYDVNNIYTKIEAGTLKTYGGKRADGLICFYTSKDALFTASLEAKSHKTLGALLPYWLDEKLSFWALGTSFVSAAISLIFGLHYSWWIALIVFVVILIAVFLMFIAVSMIREPVTYKAFDVVDQVHQYPANEKWISLSKDSLNLVDTRISEFRKQLNSEDLIQVCKANGIGLILVSRKQIELMLEPKYLSGEYLSAYASEQTALDFLGSTQKTI